MAVTKVTEGSLAERAGVIAGDRLLTINGNRIFAVEDLRIALALLEDGIATLEVERDGTAVKLPFTVGSVTQ